jgi:predicted transcriptional regulator
LTPKPDTERTERERKDSEDEKQKEAVQKATSKLARINREMRKLDSTFNPTSMERQNIIETDEDGTEVTKQVHFVFLAGSEHRAPETINEALDGPEKDK